VSLAARQSALFAKLDSFEAAYPGAFQLATLGSLASRLEPQLLRALRLGLAPPVDAGAEADLWFSPLVEIRAASGVVLRRDILPVLRERLADDRNSLEQAWRVTRRLHATGSPAILAEEELAYLSLVGINLPEVRSRATEVLRRLLSGLLDETRAEVVNWADRAVLRLPSNLFEIEEARLLAIAAAYRGAHLPEALENTGTDAWRAANWLKPPSRSGRAIGVRLVEGGLEIGPPAMSEAHRIEVPPMRDAVAEIGWEADGQLHSTALRIDPARIQFIGSTVESFEIALRGGDSYRLEPAHPGSIERINTPRVQITYEDPYDSERQIELPFVVGVISDLSGNNDKVSPSEFADRKFLDVRADNFNSLIAAIAPSLNLSIPDSSGGAIKVELSFSKMEHFRPEALARRTPAIAKLLETRDDLARLFAQLDGDARGEEIIATVMGDDALIARVAAGDSSPLAEIASKAWESNEVAAELISALGKFVRLLPDSPSLRSFAPRHAVGVARGWLDEKLEAETVAILHAPAFQRLERAWRGLQYLVFNTETSNLLKIRVLNASKEELVADLNVRPEAEWDQSILFKLTYESEFGTLGGEPFAYIVADFEFDHSDYSIALLSRMAMTASAALCPLLGAAGPNLLGMDSFLEIGNPRDLGKLVDTPDYASWHALRDGVDSRFVGLCLPRALGRLPYGAKTDPVELFPFEEPTHVSPDAGAPSSREHVAGHELYCWINSAYAMAANINRAYAQYGWPVRIRGTTGGKVANLPSFAAMTDEGGISLQCSAEVAIGDRREAELAKIGLMTLQHPGSSTTVFNTASSIYRPKTLEVVEATASEAISCRLQYLFPVSRFAQYIKCMVRDKIGSTKGITQLVRWLQGWLNTYVDIDPEHSSTSDKAERPLAAAKITIVLNEQRPGAAAKLFLRPSYQLGEMEASMTLVVALATG
jgi:type VI secretion system protein ImpC